MQKKIIIANWKMNPSSSKEATTLLKNILKDLKNIKNTDIVFCPPFIYLESLNKIIKKYTLGSQNLFYKDEGAYTGEVSYKMLENLGVKYSILGHSERRSEGEDNNLINLKLKTLAKSNIIPILCIGEKERDTNHEYVNFLQNQILACVEGLNKKVLEKLIIAYEPVWAIGKDATRDATPEEFLEIKILIKKTLSLKFGAKNINNIRIIYGGSVDDKNIGGFLSIGESDGFLVGRASLDSKKFIKIVSYVENNFKIHE
jgi:triosephosphate isomerase